MNEDKSTQKVGGSPAMIFVGLGLVIAMIVLAYIRQEVTKEPVSALPVLGEIEDFTLTNQLNQVVTLADLGGVPWVANIIFTRCPGPCLSLSKQFSELQARLPKDSNARLVTFTIDPGYDDPEVLAKYGNKLGADPSRWWFLTGTTNELKQVAIRDLKFSARGKAEADRESEEDLFVHSTYFMVVDGRGRHRAVVDTSMEFTTKDGETVTAVDEVLSVLKLLESNP